MNRRGLGARPSAGSALGDALSELMAAERVRVNREAAGYTLTQTPVTRSQAIMAFILLMRSAMTEDTRNARHYQILANEAAYRYRAASIPNILAIARDDVKAAPRTHEVAVELYGAAASATVAPATPARRRAAPAAVEDDGGPLTISAPYATPMPAWVKPAAGATLVALAVWAFWPKRGGSS